jgi:hypothetical protein
VERKPGLGRVELDLQLADAALAAPEHLEDGEAGLIGQRVEQAGGGAEASIAHAGRYIKIS